MSGKNSRTSIEQIRGGSQSSSASGYEHRDRKLTEEVDDVALLGPLKPFRGHAGNAVPVRSVIAGMPREGIEHSFAVSAGPEQVPHKFRAFKLETASASIFLVVQAAAEDWNLVAPGFDLVLASFAVDD